MAVILQYSADGSTFTNLTTPAAISGDAEDIDLDSYRSVVSGNMIRTIIGYKWQKIGISYNYLSEDDAAALMNTFREANNVYIKVKSPVLSSSGTTILKGYVSQLHFDWVQTGAGEGGWSISFNFVEGVR